MAQRQLSTFLLGLNGVLMLALYLCIGHYYRLATDDMMYASVTQQHGVWGGMVQFWNEWNPRWSSTLVVNLVLSHYGPTSLFLFQIFTLGLMMVGFGGLALGLNARFDLRLSRLQLMLWSTYLTGSLFMLSPSKSDTWYWITTTPMYLHNVALLLLALGLVLHERASAWVVKAVLFLIGLYVGGANEAMAISALIIAFWILYGSTALSPIGRAKLHAVTLGLCIGFGLLALGPGIWSRHGATPNMAGTDWVIVAAKSYLHALFIAVPKLLIVAPLLLAPLVPLGMRTLSMQCVNTMHLVLAHAKTLLVFDALIMVNAMVLAVALGDAGPDRAWFILIIGTFLILATIVFRLGAMITLKLGHRAMPIVLAFQFALTALIVSQFIIQIPHAKSYAEAYDVRMAHIHTAIAQGETSITLVPLPNAGWLPDADITPDSTHFSNRNLSVYFNKKARFVAGPER